MRAYTATLTKATLAASSTLGTITQPASALKRLSLQYIQMGSYATADNAYQMDVQRITALGASPGTAVTPQLRDAADGAASALCYKAPANEPTYTANAIMLSIFAHQRSTYQWYAAPGHEIVVPATNLYGLGLFMTATTASFNAGAVIEFEE